MSVLASDNFNRADDPTGLGSNWTDDHPFTTPLYRFNLVSNAAVPSDPTGGDASAHYNGVTWPNDHYSKAALTTVGTAGASGAGLTVRSSSSGTTWNGYVFIGDHAASNNMALFKVVGGSFFSVGSSVTQAWTNGDTFEFGVQGSTLTVKRNGTTISGLTNTDTSLTSGSAGIYWSAPETSGSVDNWEGGDFTAGAQDTPELYGSPRLSQRQMQQLLAL